LIEGVVKAHLHGVSSGRLLAGVALGKSPVEGVGQAVLAQVAKGLVLDLKGREVGCFPRVLVKEKKRA
jgi:hypothetical protein